jgi:uncharacterized protein YqeY
MTLKSTIQDDMKSAMKAGDKDRLKVVRLILSEIKQVEVDKRIELDDPAVLAVLEKMVKQRRDSVAQFSDGGRDDLAAIELSEIEVIQAYLPEPLDPAELEKIIDQAIQDTGASGMRDMGKVMAAIKARAQGRADIGAVSGIVKARLS